MPEKKIHTYNLFDSIELTMGNSNSNPKKSDTAQPSSKPPPKPTQVYRETQLASYKPNPKLNILDMPESFLRLLMRKIEIQDRQRLRLTCRAFEQIVAATDAGRFASGMLFVTNTEGHQVILVRYGDKKFKFIEFNEHTAGMLHHIRNRLFNGISFNGFSIMVNNASALGFIREFTDKFEMDEALFQAHSGTELANVMQLYDHFPKSQHHLVIHFVPTAEQLQSLPKIDLLKVYNDSGVHAQLSSDTWFKLLAATPDLFMLNQSVILNEEEWRETMQIIAADARPRVVAIQALCAEMAHYLNSYGVTESDKTGHKTGEFELLGTFPDEEGHSTTKLRYRQCRINIFCEKTVWTGDEDPCSVVMSNAFLP